ncbi:MAG: Hpt domain-containing protein [Thaumarchaeota archaeon]|nr:Hpt domain-containing protein [Nitrososphaerota archaeon]
MSDNFLKIARKEIQDELDLLQKIIANCKNDSDVSNNAKEIERHLHKIKGLAPMMGQVGVGEVARVSDVILKHVISNGILHGTYQALVQSNMLMRELFGGSTKKDLTEFKNKIRQKFPSLRY